MIFNIPHNCTLCNKKLYSRYDGLFECFNYTNYNSDHNFIVGNNWCSITVAQYKIHFNDMSTTVYKQSDFFSTGKHYLQYLQLNRAFAIPQSLDEFNSLIAEFIKLKSLE